MCLCVCALVHFPFVKAFHFFRQLCSFSFTLFTFFSPLIYQADQYLITNLFEYRINIDTIQWISSALDHISSDSFLFGNDMIRRPRQRIFGGVGRCVMETICDSEHCVLHDTKNHVWAIPGQNNFWSNSIKSVHLTWYLLRCRFSFHFVALYSRIYRVWLLFFFWIEKFESLQKKALIDHLGNQYILVGYTKS